MFLLISVGLASEPMASCWSAGTLSFWMTSWRKEEGSGGDPGPCVSHHPTDQPWLVHTLDRVSKKEIGGTTDS